MKKLILAAFMAVSVSAYSQWNIPVASPRQSVEQQFSMSKISVDYGRPAVKGRTIFGDLVPFGKVWRAGANSATKITFGQAVNFGGKEVMAGTYGLFILPQEKEWKIILNKDSDQWGAFTYDEKLNVVDITVPVQKMTEKQEYFEVSLNPMDENKIDLVFKWDMTKVVLPISTGKPEMVAKIVGKLKEIKQIEKDSAPKK
ncbi:DUF2911 domain-containing protein [Kaistella sp. 97-N-M2]|uniref:DUF2911 domain-containing protein n=1 Tax=Kaistella sp. 97-N-M2 TaxID=2908645 RepID=UPI001F277A15|nr:DUF2911 domain-containing protein [Kaistella sp. 97-N-M2]UJF29503.1 DUF2911 domain-containing protein [Kaistella sp. 97-N-M2]